VPAVTLTTADLAPFATIDDAKAQAMIDTALARAARVAPCVRDETLSDDNAEAVKGILRDAVLRWHESGSGAVTQQSAGPFQQTIDNRQQRRGLFWPSDIEELQAVCRDHLGDGPTGAFAVDTVGTSIVHADWCSINFGANYCDCGAVLAGYAIFGEPA
jgi:hypothetical protein